MSVVSALRALRRAALAAAVVACPACSDDVDLVVDLRTDWRPGLEFTQVRVERSGEPLEATVREDAALADAHPEEDYLRGVRVADFLGIPAGPSHVRLTLLDARGEAMASRTTDLDLDGSFALTVVISRSCAGVACPGPADSASATECHDGRCVDPRCSAAAPEHCGPVGCEEDGHCAGSPGCASTRCREGVCLCAELSDAGPVPDSGPGPDAFVPPEDAAMCECVPGTSDEESETCGACGEGTHARSRTCDADCTWGAFGDWAACATSAECGPAETGTETRACGNCDLGSQTRTRSCDPTTCLWGAWSSFGACAGGGACATGATRACANGDSCGNEVCSGTCRWGACVPRAGAACLRIGPGSTVEGSNFRCCGPSRWQFCLSGCVWSTACSVCSCPECP